MDRYDFKLDNDGDLDVVGNDFVYSISDQQHIEDTINAAPGWWKENPADGVNIRSYIKSAGQESILARKIKLELISDLYNVDNPIINYSPDGKLNIQPNVSSI